MLGMVWEMLYFAHLYDRSYIFFPFHFIFELLIILMAMINIVKTELINSCKNCLVNIFWTRIFLTTELFLICLNLIWSRSRGKDIIWTYILFDTVSNEWILKTVYQQNSLFRKIPLIPVIPFFWPKRSYRVWLLMCSKWRMVVRVMRMTSGILTTL